MAIDNSLQENFLKSLIGKKVYIVYTDNNDTVGLTFFLMGFDSFSLLLKDEYDDEELIFKHSIRSISKNS